MARRSKTPTRRAARKSSSRRITKKKKKRAGPTDWFQTPIEQAERLDKRRLVLVVLSLPLLLTLCMEPTQQPAASTWIAYFLFAALLLLRAYDARLPPADNLMQFLAWSVGGGAQVKTSFSKKELEAARGQPPMKKLIGGCLKLVGMSPWQHVAPLETIKVPRRGGGSGGTIDVHVIRAKHEVPGQGPRGLLVWIHGGGMCVGNARHEIIAAHLAAASISGRYAGLEGLGSLVVCSVDYRLAPEHPFPAGLDDCLDALDFLPAKAVADWGCEPGRVGVAGASAGGGLAAAVCIASPVPLKAALLLIPMVAPPGMTLSQIECSTPSLSTGIMAFFWRCYTGNPTRPCLEARRGEWAPLLASDEALAQFPPTYVQTSSCDPLRDEGEMLVRRLENVGVPVEHRRSRGSHVGGLIFDKTQMSGGVRFLFRAMAGRMEDSDGS